MKPSKSDLLLSIERRTRTKDDIGGTQETWEEVFRSWGTVRPVSGRLRVLHGKEGGDATHHVELREEQGVKAEDRIVVEGASPAQVLLIQGVLRTPGRRGCELTCREIVP